MSRMQTVYSKDTYHGFPVLPDDINGLTAVVAGISRAHMARAFSSIILRRTNGELEQVRVLSGSPSNGAK